MTPRYSGRTAVTANISVHEPKPPQDDDSPLTFSMEGIHSQEPAALRPFVWSPGWNSNQSINRFQDEIGGACKGGDPGIRLLAAGNDTMEPYALDIDEPGEPVLVRRHHIFGSDELSKHAPAIAGLVPRPYCAVGTGLAD
ncbi:MAG: NADH-quinone oxidoreductase subunit G, partial [Desulfuromonadales bacterium]|nr:NADH-quinone oxidoreductase subunit G [Desulfuromonadales bacterium]